MQQHIFANVLNLVAIIMLRELRAQEEGGQNQLPPPLPNQLL